MRSPAGTTKAVAQIAASAFANGDGQWITTCDPEAVTDRLAAAMDAL